MPSPVTRKQFDAVLFDLDGVLTITRAVHAAAWKRTSDEFLRTWDARHGTASAPFDERRDYTAHVDGKPRQDGVRAFLTARGIQLPEGSPDSGPEEESVWGLGNRKQPALRALRCAALRSCAGPASVGDRRPDGATAAARADPSPRVMPGRPAGGQGRLDLVGHRPRPPRRAWRAT